MNRLLGSGVFSRSPNLERIITYLCEEYFAGRGSLVKEYSIATQVLGRPDSFDPKKDSIVRVEIHRLRKRLKDHYEKLPGEPIRILLPEKSYVPEFQYADPAFREPEPPPATPWHQRRWVHGAAAVGLLLAALIWMRAKESTKASDGPEPPPVARDSRTAEAPAPLAAGQEIRILAGHTAGKYVDRYGNTWEPDKYFKGGQAVAGSGDVRTGGWDANIFTEAREGAFEYDIPLQPGIYELMLFFAETAYGEGRPLGTESRRSFSVAANGVEILSAFDVLAESADPNVAWVKRFKDLSPGQDGRLHLQFRRVSGANPFLNGILIRPGTKGKMRPLRMVCRNQAFRDQNGTIWEPDHYYHGGTQITRPHGAPSSDHVQGERFGYFNYTIPVPAGGKYGARLYFWEYWWGKDQPGKGGAGSRVFDVYCNHRPLLLDFDIIKRATKEQTVVETFHGLEPDARGVLQFDFIAKRNYALLNAMEVFDESK